MNQWQERKRPVCLECRFEFESYDATRDFLDKLGDHSEATQLSGDLLISFERVLENADNQGVVFQEELRRVMAHGLLHLAGFKDKTPADAAAMRQAEDHALALFHVEHRA